MRHLEPSWSTDLDDGRSAHVLVTDRRHGDLGSRQNVAVANARRRAVVDAPWSWFRQVHGNAVFTVERPGHGAGEVADGACTNQLGAPMAVQVADCAPVAFVDTTGVLGIAHAGWRGLLGGVLQGTVDAMESLGAQSPKAILGPCIGPQAYEFGCDDLDTVAEVLGESVRSTTTDGRPALDMRAGVRSVLATVGVDVVAEIGGCTATDAERWWSHRARGDSERQALVVWADQT